MAPLSDKAKGKQRATEPPCLPAGSSQPSAPPAPRHLIIRFTDGEPDLSLQLPANAIGRDVKRMIRDARTHLARKRLRLIVSGKLLGPQVFLGSVLDTLDSRQRQAVSSSVYSTGSPQQESLKTGTKPQPDTGTGTGTWLHCAIGPELEEGEEEDSSTIPADQLRPLRGFDRLAAAGLSPEDIEGIRNTFHARQQAFVLSGALDSEAADEHARQLEERWIDGLEGGTATGTGLGATTGDDGNGDGDGDPNIDGNTSARPSPVVLGLITGFFFPIAPLFFLKDAVQPYAWANGAPVETQMSVIFGRRMQIGIILGVAANVMFALWRYMIAVDDQHL